MGFYETRVQIERLLGCEQGTMRRPFGSGFAVGLVYPNSYQMGMSNLGYQIVYRMVNERPGWTCERFFCGFDPLLSFENLQQPQAFTILAFSVSFELDYLNVLAFLEKAGIPLAACDRTASHPLIVVGGVCVSVNHAPILPYADIVVNGEAEAVIPDLLDAFEDNPGNRARLLCELAVRQGFLVSEGAMRACGMDAGSSLAGQIPGRLCRVWTENPAQYAGYSQIITENTEFSGMCLVELSRGCPYRCTFCHVGHNLKPYRWIPAETVMSWIGCRTQMTSRFGLIAAAVGAHPEIERICGKCEEMDLEISFSSLRAEDVSPAILRALARSHTQTITIAPEAGAPHLRRLLGKARLTEDRMLEVAEQAVLAGVPNLKMYFMTGLPGETEEDVLCIPELVRRIGSVFTAASKTHGRIGKISLDLHIFVPKPGTPLHRIVDQMPAADSPQVRKHLQLLQRHLKRLGNVSFQVPSVALAQTQRILSNEDAPAAEFLLQAHKAGGDWKAALKWWQKRAL